MSLQMRSFKQRIPVFCCILSLILCLIWLGFIFSNSLKNAEESGAQSSKVHTVVNQVAAQIGVKEEITEETVRNGAHFIEFAVMAVCIDLTVSSFWWALGAKHFSRLLMLSVLSVPICFLLASLDEFLQKFSEARATQFSDVLLDTSGAMLAEVLFVGLCLLVWQIVRQKQAKKMPE